MKPESESLAADNQNAVAALLAFGALLDRWEEFLARKSTATITPNAEVLAKAFGRAPPRDLEHTDFVAQISEGTALIRTLLSVVKGEGFVTRGKRKLPALTVVCDARYAHDALTAFRPRLEAAIAHFSRDAEVYSERPTAKLTAAEAREVLGKLRALHFRYAHHLSPQGIHEHIIEREVGVVLYERWSEYRLRLKSVDYFKDIPDRPPPKPHTSILSPQREHLSQGILKEVLDDITWAINLLDAYIDAGGEMRNHETTEPKLRSTIRIFVSHAAADRPLAKAFTRWLEGCLTMPAGILRCTSVAPYKLEIGDPDGRILRADLEASKVVLALISDASLASAYVAMELGAGWAFGSRVGYLLLPHISFDSLKGPIAGNNATHLNDSDDLYGLVATLARDASVAAKPTQQVGIATREFVEFVDSMPAPPGPKPKSAKARPPIADEAGGSLLVQAWARTMLLGAGPHTLRLDEVDERVGLEAGLAKKIIAEALAEDYVVTIAGDVVRLQDK